MYKFVVTSLRQSAGKTSMIVGISKALKSSIAYIKPMGERFLYRKKRLWDYDAALVTSIFGLKENPEEMSIGFYHSKLHSVLDEQTTREKVHELLTNVGTGKELFFAECGKDITYGASVHLDAISIAEQLDARLIIVVSGDGDAILDDLFFLRKYIRAGDTRMAGVIINKVSSFSDFCDTRLPLIRNHGFDVLGVVPFYKELHYFSLSYLADRLFAKTIATEDDLNRTVKNIFIGNMSVDTALQNPSFQEDDKVVITRGDRGDMMIAAMESDAIAVILTNNIMPSSNLIARAKQLNIPLLLVSADIYDIARQIENMEPLLTKNDSAKIGLLEEVVKSHINLESLTRL